MFKRSRRRIVAAIMSILAALWVGTLGVIYLSSYAAMTGQDRQMLMAHSEMYVLSSEMSGVLPGDMPFPDAALPGFEPGFTESPMFRLSVFYTVAVAYDGSILEIQNDPPTVHTDEELCALAQEVIESGKEHGRDRDLAYFAADKGGYMLVSFMDNTVMNQRAMTLFRFTLIFGAAALILFFFLSVFLARKIVDPLEENYQKQKQFVSDAGHELKTPVAVISANADLLSREIGDNRWLANIQYENRRMGTLVGQLLELARTESVTPKTERIDLSRLVQGEALPFESVAFEKGVSLKSDVADGIYVEGNSTQLRQIVSILLDNAIRHSEAHSEAVLALKKEGAHTVLAVSNCGDEIPAEQRERIFERFYRTDTARSGEDGRYGLGLAIAKAIADAHRGTIGVDCRDGIVEFRVRLPLA